MKVQHSQGNEEGSELSKSPHVSIVDDDESIRESIKSLLRSVGVRADSFASAEEFLNAGYQHDAACLILDVRMPGMGGLELQQRLAAAGRRIPIIFITAHVSDEEARRRALQSGAIDFLFKPFSEEVLLNDVYTALSRGW
jgi:FixJ family two-component response regulator